MARETFTQTNWFGGQIAEQRFGNATDEQYMASSATIENLVVRPTGSLTRRPGTKFVARTDGNTSLGNEGKAVRLVPFVFGHESANNYVLEFGQGYIKIYKNSAPLDGTNTSNVAETHLKITGTPYDTNEKLQDLQFVQSADILFLVTPKVKPYKLSRSTGTTAGTWRTSDGFEWALAEFPYKNGPYLGQQEDSVTGSTDTVLEVSGGTAITTHNAERGKAFINENFGGATQQFAKNGAYVGYTGNYASLSYFQVKNHGLQEGMLITLSGGNGLDGSGTFTVDTANDHISDSSHGLTDGDQITFTSTGTLPAPLSTEKTYYVRNSATNNFKVALHIDGAVVDITNTGSGTHSYEAGPAPRNGTWTVRNPTANTFQIATSATADISVFHHQDSEGISEKGATEHYVFAQYYAKGDTLTLTAKDKAGSAVNIFTTASNGRHFRISLLKKGQIWWVWGKLSGITTDQNTATFTLEEDCPLTGDLTGLTSWKFGEFYTDQYPHHIAIFQQRLVFARNTRSPQTVWFSQTADFENFAPSEQLGSATGQTTASGASVIGDQILATNGMTFTFDSGTIDEIQWLVAQQKLIAGSTGGIYAVYGSEQDLTITPFNFTIKRESTQPAQTGSNAIPYDSNILFIQGTGKKVRLITYGDISSSATSADMTFRATDILQEQAVQVVETDIPNFVSWFRLKDGTIVGLTYIPQQETIAWHQHKIGGDYSYDNTRGGDPTGNLTTDKSHAVVLDMCTIPSSTRDQLWMLVRRTIPVADGGNSERIIETVEVMEDWMSTEAISNSNYLDGFVEDTTGSFTVTTDYSTDNRFDATAHGLVVGDVVSFTGDDLPAPLVAGTDYYVKTVPSANEFTVATVSATGTEVALEDDGTGTRTCNKKSINGIGHLQGETLGILSDGSVLDDQVVTSNEIIPTGSKFTTRVLAGARFTSKLISLPIAIGPAGRIRIGNKKRIHRTWVKIHRTPNFKFAIYNPDINGAFDESQLVELVTRTVANEYGEAPYLSSETKELIPKSAGFTDGQFIVQQADPLPLNILAYEVDFETNDN